MVVAASPLAQRDGVRVDTPLTEAKALLSKLAYRQRQPKAEALRGQSAAGSTAPSAAEPATPQPFYQIFQHVPQEDRAALQVLAAELDSFSPIVGLPSGVDQPDCIFLEITGLEQLFDGEAQLAEEVNRFCQAQGYLPRIGIAHTIGLAQALAQYATNAQTGIVSIPAEACQQIQADPVAGGSFAWISELPLAGLRLKPETARTLEQLGVFRIGQLLRIPRRELFSRFGDEIHGRLDQFTGGIDEPIDACSRPREFHAEQLLDHPTHHKETLEVILERLIEKICQQLRASQQGALQWTIRLFGQQGLPFKLQVRLFAPAAHADQVVPLARMQLEQLFQPEIFQRQKRQLSQPVGDPPPSSSRREQWIQWEGRPLDVTEVTVTVTSSVLLEQRQRELFDESPRADKQALAHLINRLSGRLGYRNVVVPSLVSGNQPEYGYQLQPLVHAAERQNRGTLAPVEVGRVLQRPIRVIHPPRPLEVIADAPRRRAEAGESTSPWEITESAPPAMIRLEERSYRVTQSWGPERIETGWWRGKLVRRDYWKIELQTHQQLWVYFDLRRQQWFWHGEF